MSKPMKLFSTFVEVVEYDPNWSSIYEAERKLILEATEFYIAELEHIGSTVIPGQRAKPIIDMTWAISFSKQTCVIVSFCENSNKDRYFICTSSSYRPGLREKNV
jgi:GrpB-like predicted nucleotidyltransferase (UPF0157 family)